MATVMEEGTLLERAAAISPLVEKYSELAEQERRLPRPLFEAVHDAGFFEMLKPRAFHGLELDLETTLNVVEELARQDGSLGWNVMLGAASGLLADYLPEDSAMQIFGQDWGTIAGSFAPNGKAVPVDGGYRISGRWQFASGCQNADWMVCGCIVSGAVADGAGPDIRLFFLPASECEIVDTWYTTGMRGTGSNDFVIEDVFVPSERQFVFAALRSGPPPRLSRGHAQPFFAIASPTMAAVSLGIARDAIETFKELATTKTPRAGSTVLANQHTIHERVGLAEATLLSARAYVHEIARSVECGPWSKYDDGVLDPAAATDMVAHARLAAAFAAKSASDAVDLMFDAGGGTSIYAKSRLDRCFRNVHMVSHHIAVAPSNIEMAGQYFLGLGLQVRR